ncbi:MAG: TIGR04086 family membrane protein [Clostridia bacterium]|nr:TIGR04086 family membrane protein [Clostridia bacterium]
MKKIRAPKDRSQPKKEKNFLVSVMIGVTTALLSGIILLVLFCFPALMLEDPLQFAPAFAIASLFLATIFGSYLSAHIHRKSGLACGALCSFLMILLIISVSFILDWNIRVTVFAICAPALLICSMIAGICGVSSEKSVKPKHKIKF